MDDAGRRPVAPGWLVHGVLAAWAALTGAAAALAWLAVGDLTDQLSGGGVWTFCAVVLVVSVLGWSGPAVVRWALFPWWGSADGE